MKRSLQLCLVFLISLALPLSGMAGVRVQANPCPMNAAGMTEMTEMTDCCQDMGPAEHGKPCKSGQDCKSGSLLQVSAVKPPICLSCPVVISFSSNLLPIQAPSGVWRPPRV